MNTPEEIAKALTEDIRFNNGLILETGRSVYDYDQELATSFPETYIPRSIYWDENRKLFGRIKCPICGEVKDYPASEIALGQGFSRGCRDCQKTKQAQQPTVV